MSAGVRRWVVIGLVVVAGLLGFWLQRSSGQQAPGATASRAQSMPAQSTPAQSQGGTSGLPVCVNPPPEVDEAVAAVRNDGPYLRPRDDGGVFGNRERLLPAEPNGYYREYTVEAPRERFPGPRRLITGGQAKLGAEPEIWFYTDDHYESFCELRTP